MKKPTKKEPKTVPQKTVSELAKESYESYVLKLEQESWFQVEEDILASISNVTTFLDSGPAGGGFDTWPPEKLISAREKLSRYSELLGDKVVSHETKSDFLYLWRKGMYASDWLPIKEELRKALGDKERITDSTTDQVLTDKYIEVQYLSAYHRHRADHLHRKLDALDRYLRTIDHRLYELYRQLRLPQDNSYKPPVL